MQECLLEYDKSKTFVGGQDAQARYHYHGMPQGTKRVSMPYCTPYALGPMQVQCKEGWKACTYLVRFYSLFDLAPQPANVAQGGLVMMRPCKKTYEAMLQIIAESPQYQFVGSYAEQDFLNWYFRYTAVDLPTRYNLNFRWLDGQGLGPGGAEPVLIHFADPPSKERLFNATEADPLWSFLCYQPQLSKGVQAAQEQQAEPDPQRDEPHSGQQQPVHTHSTQRIVKMPAQHRHALPTDNLQETLHT